MGDMGGPSFAAKALSFQLLSELWMRDGHWPGLRLEEDGRRRMAVNVRLPSEPGVVAAIPIDHFDGFDTIEDLPRSGRCVRDC